MRRKIKQERKTDMKTTIIGSVGNKPLIISDKTIAKLKSYGRAYICRKIRALADKIELDGKNKEDVFVNSK